MVRFLASTNIWYGDGTFESVPRMPSAGQIFAIVCVWGHTVIPIAWAIMQRRTEAAYEAVFRLLNNLFLEENARPIVTRIISDYEQALINIWPTVSPEAVLQGCLWHYARALVNMAKELGLARWIREVPHIHTILRLCCALPLLPRHLMMRGLTLIVREAMTQGDFLYQLLRPFLRYVHNNWVNNRRRRFLMNVYGSNHRTNNACESHNNMLQRALEVNHPNIFFFIGILLRLEMRAHDDVSRLNQGYRPSRSRRASSLRNDERIRNLQEDLREPPGPLDDAISRLLHVAGHVLENIINDHLEP